MKAITYTKYGGSDVLQLDEIKKPAPGKNEILIKVLATSVTAGDARMRSFTVPAWQWLFARIYLGIFRPKRKVLGMELSGIVEEVGEKVTKFKVGDEIFASVLGAGFGAYAEYKCINENGVVALKPSNISHTAAATLPIGAGTALRLLKKGNINNHKNVLIYGASGSVGTYAVQIAKYLGARVTGVCSTSNVAFVESAGADTVIDYSRENIETFGKYDLVFDAVGKIKKSMIKKVLLKNGAFISVIGNSGKEKKEDLDFIRQLVEGEAIRPIISRTFRLEEIREAHEIVDKGHKRGNFSVIVA